MVSVQKWDKESNEMVYQGTERFEDVVRFLKTSLLKLWKSSSSTGGLKIMSKLSYLQNSIFIIISLQDN